MFREQNQSQTHIMTDLDLKYSLCQQFLNLTKTRDSSLEEIYLMYEQNQILNNIKNHIEVKKASKLINPNNNTIEDPQIENLSMSTILFKPERPSFKRPPINRSSSKNLNRSSHDGFEPVKNNIDTDLQESLKEISQKCSEHTTSQIRQIIKKLNNMNAKLVDFDKVSCELQKCRKQLQQTKIHEGQLQRKILQSQKRIKTSNNSVNSQIIRKQNQRIAQKEKYISKMETSMTLNSKRINQDLKRLNAKSSFIQKQQRQLQHQRRMVEQIWDSIIDKLQSPSDSFKNDIYLKCKQSLRKQRNVLKEQSQELDKQHANMNRIISQIESSK